MSATRLPGQALDVLERGAFCYAAADTPAGPHLTPIVFVVSRDRIWLTTSRSSVKARAWRREPRVAGLVPAGEGSVAFSGRSTAYDLLDPATWERGLLRSPALTAASVRFTRKNARFFAGYAVDAHQVPLSWTPPGRVFVEVELDQAVVLESGRPVETWGSWPGSSGPVPTRTRFRAVRSGPDPLEALPGDVRDALGDAGDAALAVEGEVGSSVLRARWVVDGAALYAALPEAALTLANVGGDTARVALAIDRASWWRARLMVGMMVRGTGEIVAPDRLVSGGRSAGEVLARAGAEPEGAALIRVRPARLVWWRGWSSGTVTPP